MPQTTINRLWIACTSIMIGVLWVMTMVHADYISLQGKQIKQLEVAVATYMSGKTK
jgi:hypothetical protein